MTLLILRSPYELRRFHKHGLMKAIGVTAITREGEIKWTCELCGAVYIKRTGFYEKIVEGKDYGY